MEKRIKISEILRNLRTNGFLLNCEMPMSYVQGLPVLQIKNDQLCLVVPFLRYRVTGHVDKTMVYPIRFTITMVLPEQKMIGFKDFKFCEEYKSINFEAPVGLFRHEAVKNMNKKEYNEKRELLLSYYDKVINSLLYGDEYSAQDEQDMRALMGVIIEPSLIAMYKSIDEDFYNKYLA